MKRIQLIAMMLFVLIIGQVQAAAVVTQGNGKTAQEVMAKASTMQNFEEQTLRNEIESLSAKEKAKLFKMALKEAKNDQKAQSQKPSAGLYILAIFIPPLAVGIHTGWEKPTLYNFLWTLLGWAPGVIHAFIVLGR